MKKGILAVVILLALLGIAVLTCPDKQAHKDAIMAVVNEKINERISSSEEEEGLATLAGTLGSGIVGLVLDNRLTVKNHFAFSTGDIRDLEGNEQRISVGVFGHVFTFSKEDLDKSLDGLR